MPEHVPPGLVHAVHRVICGGCVHVGQLGADLRLAETGCNRGGQQSHLGGCSRLVIRECRARAHCRDHVDLSRSGRDRIVILAQPRKRPGENNGPDSTLELGADHFDARRQNSTRSVRSQLPLRHLPSPINDERVR